VAIVVPVDALTGPDGGRTAEVVGHGPIPAALAKDILAGSHGKRWWRRLFTAPHGGVVGGDPARRCFDAVRKDRRHARRGRPVRAAEPLGG
jgi:hypothetical protein